MWVWVLGWVAFASEDEDDVDVDDDDLQPGIKPVLHWCQP